MKALTLWQPWASLVAFGEKRVETRCWTTKYRGPLLIHAAAKEPPDWLGASRFRSEFGEAVRVISERHNWGEWYWPVHNPNGPLKNLAEAGLGSILCLATLAAVETVEVVRDDLSEQERLFGNYEDGRYAWFLENVQRLESPLPAKGNRMLWNYAAEVPLPVLT